MSGERHPTERREAAAQSTTCCVHGTRADGITRWQLSSRCLHRQIVLVLRLLGIATYLAWFFANFREITAPIRQLLLKDVDFRWNDALHGVALQKLKVLLTNALVLSYYDVTKPILVQCDSSQYAIGTVVLQGNKPM